MQEAVCTHLASIDSYFTEDVSPQIISINRRNGVYSYAAIAPIRSTNWTIITFYSAASLFNPLKLMPLFILLPLILVAYVINGAVFAKRLLLDPFQYLIDSVGRMAEAGAPMCMAWSGTMNSA